MLAYIVVDFEFAHDLAVQPLDVDVILSKEAGGRVPRLKDAESFIRAPEGRIELQCLSVVLHCLLAFGLQFSDLTKEVEASSAVWNFLHLV